MTARVIFVAGLPGSGKTPYLESLRVDGWRVFDDFQADAKLNSPAFRNSRNYDDLLSALRSGQRCVVADMRFCIAAYRGQAEALLRREVPDAQVELQFFANDPQQCEANIRGNAERHPGRRLEKLNEYASAYTIPVGSAAMHVWKPDDRTKG